jgi:hypothetical protein
MGASTGAPLRPNSLEVPGIEPSPKISLTCGNVESDDAKQRENT